MTLEISPDELHKAIVTQHSGTASLMQSVLAHEEFEGKTIWNGAVHVFDLKKSPNRASKTYAWIYEMDDRRRVVFDLLHTGSMDFPTRAVRAAVVTEVNAK